MDFIVDPRLRELFCLALPGCCLVKQVHFLVHLCMSLANRGPSLTPFDRLRVRNLLIVTNEFLGSAEFSNKAHPGFMDSLEHGSK